MSQKMKRRVDRCGFVVVDGLYYRAAGCKPGTDVQITKDRSGITIFIEGKSFTAQPEELPECSFSGQHQAAQSTPAGI